MHKHQAKNRTRICMILSTDQKLRPGWVLADVLWFQNTFFHLVTSNTKIYLSPLSLSFKIYIFICRKNVFIYHCLVMTSPPPTFSISSPPHHPLKYSPSLFLSHWEANCQLRPTNQPINQINKSKYDKMDNLKKIKSIRNTETHTWAHRNSMKTQNQKP